jgi:hypothetical protein
VESPHRKPAYSVELDDLALDRIANVLADRYFVLYGERPDDSRASLTGNLLVWVFDGGLTVADEWLLGSGQEENLREFRRHFFEVADGRMSAAVVAQTGVLVTFSFYGFDPMTRTSHAGFVLDSR